MRGRGINCCVPECHSNQKNTAGQNVSFFGFPKNEKDIRSWLHVIRATKTYTQQTKICSKHFSVDDLVECKYRRGFRTVRAGAIPSLNLPATSPKPIPIIQIPSTIQTKRRSAARARRRAARAQMLKKSVVGGDVRINTGCRPSVPGESVNGNATQGFVFIFNVDGANSSPNYNLASLCSVDMDTGGATVAEVAELPPTLAESDAQCTASKPSTDMSVVSEDSSGPSDDDDPSNCDVIYDFVTEAPEYDDGESMDRFYTEQLDAISSEGTDEGKRAVPPSHAADIRLHCQVEYACDGEPTSSRPDHVHQAAVRSAGNNFQYVPKTVLSYCYFCHKPVAYPTRHLVSKHKEEPEIDGILLESLDLNRKNQWDVIQNRGNHLHNAAALKAGKGIIVVCGNGPTAKGSYTFCTDCTGYYRVANHLCPARRLAERRRRRETFDCSLKRDECLQKFQQLLRIPCRKTDYQIMHNDSVIQKWGWLLVAEGMYLERSNMIPYAFSRLVLVSLVLQQLRRKVGNHNLNLEQALHPDNVGHILEVVQRFKSRAAGRPASRQRSYRQTVLFALIQCAAACKAVLLQSVGSEDGARKYDEFMRLCIPEIHFNETPDTNS